MVNVSHHVIVLSLQSFFKYIFRFLLYFKMYPEGSKYVAGQPTENWMLSLRIKRILKIYSFLLLLLIFTLAVMLEFPSPVSTTIAWILGIFSMVLSILQFIPQIHQTLKHKVRSNSEYIVSLQF